RETRRAEMWRPIATVPLAAEAVRAVRRERPTAQLARAGWGLIVSAIAFAITAWIAPRLWRTESFEVGTVIALESGAGDGLPCCRPAYDVDPPRSRVKEYFDIGRGFDELPRERHQPDCRICAGGPETLAGEPVPGWPPAAPEPVVVEPLPPAQRDGVVIGDNWSIDPSPPIASHTSPPASHTPPPTPPAPVPA